MLSFLDMLILSSASPFWVSLVPSLGLSVYRSRSFSQFVMGCRNQHLSSTCYPFWPMCLPEVKWSEVKSLSCVWLFATPWTVAYQAPSMRFSRQEYWSGLPFPSPEDLPDTGIEPGFPALQADALPSEPPGKPLVSTRGLGNCYYTFGKKFRG